MPFFSIVVISLNAVDTIARSINSVLKQKYADFEIIVKDGCSSDDTLKVIPCDERIKVLVRKDKGIYDAMNQALSFCGGEYVFFLNCGDCFYDDDVLKNAYDCIVKNGKCCLFGDVFNNSCNRLISQDYDIGDYFWYKTTLCHQSIFFPMGLLRAHSFDCSLKIAADYEIMLFFYKAGTPFVHESLLVAYYDGNGISSTKMGRRLNKKERKRIIKNNFTLGQRFEFYYRSIISKLFKKRFY